MSNKQYDLTQTALTVVWWLMCAPLFNSSFRHSTSPHEDASINGVYPNCRDGNVHSSIDVIHNTSHMGPHGLSNTHRNWGETKTLAPSRPIMLVIYPSMLVTSIIIHTVIAIISHHVKTRHNALHAMLFNTLWEASLTMHASQSCL